MAVLPRVGDTFGRYRIDSEIGRGGMGVVFGATDTAIGRTVALKVVSAGLGESTEFRQRFEREAAVLARLDSPHVIAIYDYGTEASCPYIATQYVGGGDLGALIASRGPMPAQLALQVCAQVAEALHDAHRAGVVHRDVKPANVLLRDADSPQLHAYLCDFGIARTGTDGLTQAGAVAGTWGYLAPECGRGAPATPESDLYALGCLLWALLSGAPPYRGSDVEVAVAHQRAAPPQLSGVDELSVRINVILERTLAKDPHQRYRSADQLRIDLLEAAGLAGAAAATGSGIGPLPIAVGTSPGSYAGGPLSLGSLPPRSGPTTLTGGQPTRRRTAVVTALACAGVLVVTGAVLTGTTFLGGDEPDARTSSPVTSSSTEGNSGGLGNDPTVGPTVSPTVDPTGSAPDPTAPPTRLDQGGPITGDLDGDGLGDLRVVFSHTIRTNKKGAEEETDNVVDITTWTSDGSAFVDEVTEREPENRRTAGQRAFGDFDGDGLQELIRVERTGSDDDQRDELRVTGNLSGGDRIDDSVPTRPEVAFAAVVDLDADGADDLVLQYYIDYEEPSEFAALVIDGTRLRPIRPLLEQGPTPGEAKFEVGDFDGDGRGDLAVIRDDGDGKAIGSYVSTITLWLGTETGTRRGPRTTFVGSYRPDLVAADLDGDEDDELVVVQDASLGVVDVKDGQITRPRAAGSLLGRNVVAAIGVSDLNGDGLDDLVAIQQVNDSRARLQVALTREGRFVTTGWGTWKTEFITSKYYYNYVIEGVSFE